MEGKDLKREIHLSEGTEIKGRYTIQQLIGRGGFCYTYKAFDSVLNINIAIKEYFPHGVASREGGNTVTVYTLADENVFNKGKDRFLKEARNLAQFIKNTNIVSVLDYFEENNTAYIVMEYLEGQDMKKYIGAEGNVLDFEYIKVLANDLCDTLSQIHAAGIIHRDISPDNIFVCNDGSIKLIDFGAVKQDFNLNNETVTVILKRGYAPKEQYFSKGNLGPWTDVYALAATIYRLVTGQVPQESIERLDEDRLIPAHFINTAVSENFSYALMKAMSLKVEDRYQTMQEFKTGLNDTAYHTADYYGWKGISHDNIKVGKTDATFENAGLASEASTKLLFGESLTLEEGFEEVSEMAADPKPHTAELIPQESIIENDFISQPVRSEPAIIETSWKYNKEIDNKTSNEKIDDASNDRKNKKNKKIILITSISLAAVIIAIFSILLFSKKDNLFEIKDSILIVNPSVFGKDYNYIKDWLNEGGYEFSKGELSDVSNNYDGDYKHDSVVLSNEYTKILDFFFLNGKLVEIKYYDEEIYKDTSDYKDVFLSEFKGKKSEENVLVNGYGDYVLIKFNISDDNMNGKYSYEKYYKDFTDPDKYFTIQRYYTTEN